jgi:hypothetical protein
MNPFFPFIVSFISHPILAYVVLEPLSPKRHYNKAIHKAFEEKP